MAGGSIATQEGRLVIDRNNGWKEEHRLEISVRAHGLLINLELTMQEALILRQLVTSVILTHNAPIITSHEPELMDAADIVHAVQTDGTVETIKHGNEERT